MKEEFRIFNEYLNKKGLKNTSQRQTILEVFLKTNKHLSAEDFYRLIKKTHRSIGFATVYRTLKLISESGLSREVNLGDRIVRIEHEYGHKHHDHLICIKCGKFIEVFDPEIERLQESLTKKYQFKTIRHRLDIFGFCNRCSNDK